MKEYKTLFIELMAPLDNIKLKEDIKNEMRVIGPRTLDHAMELATQIEEKLNKKPGRRWEPRPSYGYNPNTQLTTITPHLNRTQTQTYLPYKSTPTAQSVFSSPSIVSPSQPKTHIPIARPYGEIRMLTEIRERGGCVLGVMRNGQWGTNVRKRS